LLAVAHAIKRSAVVVLLLSLLFNKLCKMRQIEFEIHAAFRLVMGIKICRQSDRVVTRGAEKGVKKGARRAGKWGNGKWN